MLDGGPPPGAERVFGPSARLKRGTNGECGALVDGTDLPMEGKRGPPLRSGTEPVLSRRASSAPSGRYESAGSAAFARYAQAVCAWSKHITGYSGLALWATQKNGMHPDSVAWFYRLSAYATTEIAQRG